MMAKERDQHVLPDLLIFDPETPHSLIHVEFNFSDKKVHLNLVRKDNYEDHNALSESARTVIEDDTAYKYKGKIVQDLLPSEDKLIKQVINHITFYLWKRAS